VCSNKPRSGHAPEPDDTVLQARLQAVTVTGWIRRSWPRPSTLPLRELEQPVTAVGGNGLATLKNEISASRLSWPRYAEAIADVGPLATILQAGQVRAARPRRDAIRTELKTLARPRSARPATRLRSGRAGGIP